MALENVLKVYLNSGESSEIVEKLKELGVCLEAFFNKVQIVKAGLNSKIYLKDIRKAGESAGFDQSGVYHSNYIGARIKMTYTYFDKNGAEHLGFMLI